MQQKKAQQQHLQQQQQYAYHQQMQQQHQQFMEHEHQAAAGMLRLHAVGICRAAVWCVWQCLVAHNSSAQSVSACAHHSSAVSAGIRRLTCLVWCVCGQSTNKTLM